MKCEENQTFNLTTETKSPVGKQNIELFKIKSSQLLRKKNLLFKMNFIFILTLDFKLSVITKYFLITSFFPTFKKDSIVL